MRRIIVLLGGLLLALGMTTGSALAMQPAGEPAQDRFGCVEGDHPDSLNPVHGHPGATGIVGATVRVVAETGGTPAGDTPPTAWSAVHHAEPIDNSCA